MSTVLLDERLAQRMAEAEGRIAQLDEQLSDPAVHRDQDKLRTLGQEQSALEPVVRAAAELRGLVRDLEQAREVLEDGDPELRELAQEEATELEQRFEGLVLLVRELFLPKDPMEDRPAVVEVRAGSGGDEAGLFAADLMRMYTRYAEGQGWSVELMSVSEGIPGSIKEAIFIVRGRGVYGKLRWESGVHRVRFTLHSPSADIANSRCAWRTVVWAHCRVTNWCRLRGYVAGIVMYGRPRCCKGKTDLNRR